MKVKTTPAKTVDEYLEMVPADMKSMLEKLRQTIIKAAPKAEEIISYQIPTYKYLGPLVHFAAFKDHCSLVVINKIILKTLEKELQLYKTTGTTIHFTPAKPLPASLVQKIVKIRIKDNEELDEARKRLKK
ncbi:iron chaperone [Terrimonas alba]|uniref:iron chaperone n=1 Tax=Terrimonas alba TaxID=3349636 RepID=UPI0035F2782F